MVLARWVAVSLGWLLLAPALRAAEAVLPPVSGELTGKLAILPGRGAPELDWKLTVRADTADSRVADFVAEGPSSSARGELRLDAAGNGTWRIVEAKAELLAWSEVLVSQMGSALAGLGVRGGARLVGEGTRRGGKIGGGAYLSVSDGRLELPSQALLLEGLSLEFVLEDLVQPRSAGAQMISWTGGHYGGLALGPGRIMFTLKGDQVQVDEGVVGMLGGRVNLAAFVFSWKKPEVSVVTRAVGIDVRMLLPILPPIVAEATGTLDGTLLLKWSSAGLVLGMGQLSLRDDENAVMRLLPTPGLITDHVPAAVLQRIPNLKKIETGEASIRASRFDVSFTPDGDQAGRTGVVRIYGEPMDPSYRAPIDLTVNFRGPIQDLVSFGTSSRLRMGGNR